MQFTTADAEFIHLKRCYVCDQIFDSVSVLDHGEHVIPNAIGGGLIADGILCMACGTNLGNSVDKDLNLALRSLCAVFDIRRDRGGAIAVPARLTFKGGLSVDPPNPRFSVVRGSEPAPIAPLLVKDETTKKTYVFGANRKQAEAFLLSQKVKQLAAAGYVVELGSGIAQFVETITLDIRPDGLELSRGVLKIAIAFALQAGVAPALIRHFVVDNRDLTTDRSEIDRAVGPCYPTGWCEAAFEAARYDADDFPPNHQLAVFNLGNRLFCHVDLFGVIQRYVLLSEHWSGRDIRVRYVQKCPKWSFDPDDWTPRRPKELQILAHQFDVETGGRSWEDVQAEVLQKASSRPYELPAAGHLEKPGRILTPLAAMPIDKHSMFPTTQENLKRLKVAEEVFGSNFLTKLAHDRLSVLLFLQELDINQFRITNENGACPDLSRAKSEADLRRYQKFRLDEFVRVFADGWAIELEASAGSTHQHGAGGQS